MQRRDFIAVLAGVATAATSRPAAACIWDSDTLAQEVRGAPGVVAALVGGFARNPPKYYELRLARVSAQLEANPSLETLASYDDAGVACDRLGRHDEAIAWMERKREALDALGIARGEGDAEAPDHWYRYHANLGTFHAHRWLKRPDKWEATDDLERAHELITAAIADNLDAHFGREVYQLRILAWLRERPTMPDDAYPSLPSFLELEDRRATRDNDVLRQRGLGDAIPGLCGLITLGAAWNSFDVTLALARLLSADGRQAIVSLAHARCAEILAAGGGSLVIGAPAGSELMPFVPDSLTEGVNRPDFDALRELATSWAQRREAYMMARLDRGEHPDTHEDFWADFSEDPMRLDEAALGLAKVGPVARVREAVGQGSGLALGLGVGVVGLGLGLAGRSLLRRRASS